LQAQRGVCVELQLQLADSQREMRRALVRETAALAAMERQMARTRADAEASVNPLRRALKEAREEISRMKSEASAQQRGHRREITDLEVEQEAELERHEEETVERLRAQDEEVRGAKQRLWQERNEAAARAEQLYGQAQELTAALERLRSTSKNGLLQQVDQLQQKVRELGARRTLNQRRMGDANLDRQRAKVATVELQKTKARTNVLFGSEMLDKADDYPRLEAHAQRLECEVRRSPLALLWESPCHVRAPNTHTHTHTHRSERGTRKRFGICKDVVLRVANPLDALDCSVPSHTHPRTHTLTPTPSDLCCCLLPEA
jgi:chromosome segregation ATPase